MANWTDATSYTTLLLNNSLILFTSKAVSSNKINAKLSGVLCKIITTWQLYHICFGIWQRCWQIWHVMTPGLFPHLLLTTHLSLESSLLSNDSAWSLSGFMHAHKILNTLNARLQCKWLNTWWWMRINEVQQK